jgi:TRAP-type mannitol/chloroaromatic compound transport system substrate-binding protein
MKRRSFLKNAALAAPAAAISAPAISQGLLEWRMVTAWPKGLPGSGSGAERLAQRITKMSGGRLTVKLYSAGELVPAFGCFDAVSDGTAQMGHDCSYFHLGKSEAFTFFCSFPYGFTAAELDAWIKYGNGQKLWDELYAPFGVRGFLAGNPGAQMFGWFKKEIRSLADLQGVKYRTVGNSSRVVQKLGMTTVSVPAGEVFPALQSGAIDAAEYVGPYNDLALGLYQVCKYYYAHGYQEPGASEELIINEKAWQSLPDDLKEIVKIAAEASNNDILAEFTARSGPSIQTLVQKHGVMLKALPEDVLIALGEKSNEVLNEHYAAGNELTRRIIDDFLKFKAEVTPWTRVGELAYLNARRLPFELKIT